MSRRLIALGALAAGLALVPAAAARADTVVAGNRIVQGNQCVGALCAGGEAFSGLGLLVKSGDTPALSLVQTATSGWTPQTWELAGNESKRRPPRVRRYGGCC